MGLSPRFTKSVLLVPNLDVRKSLKGERALAFPNPFFGFWNLSSVLVLLIGGFSPFLPHEVFSIIVVVGLTDIRWVSLILEIGSGFSSERGALVCPPLTTNAMHPVQLFWLEWVRKRRVASYCAGPLLLLFFHTPIIWNAMEEICPEQWWCFFCFCFLFFFSPLPQGHRHSKHKACLLNFFIFYFFFFLKAILHPSHLSLCITFAVVAHASHDCTTMSVEVNECQE